MRRDILYFGAPDSFTHIAALKRFGPKYDYKSYWAIEKLFDVILANPTNIMVVPIENSTGGTVQRTADELVSDKFGNSDLRIHEQLESNIVLNLIGREKNLSSLRKIYSHSYALRYCEDWLKETLPNAEMILVNSTSEAAIRAKNNRKSGAISSTKAAKTYNLKIIKRNISKNKAVNVTKFYVIKKTGKNILKQSNRTSVAFSLKDRIGALCDVLGILANKKINLTRIISCLKYDSSNRNKKLDKYAFLIELEGNIAQQKVKIALDELQRATLAMHILGSYPTRKL